MKNIEDLISAINRMHATYNAGRIERETVRDFVLGLGDYGEPHGSALTGAKAWFKGKRDLEPDELKVLDLDWLRTVAEGTRTGLVRQEREAGL
ncbi:hypothetical protein [Pararhizobium sp.]|uniref:hypothetical protein n=1 Tax=Pararhizobium sp. TaxID=1977563 RepID=UPI00272023B3|nr:hypothetical protein [Pararhizobium sp.]MDO9418742.1 hypothetical protein [Pararhizobium sp.]